MAIQTRLFVDVSGVKGCDVAAALKYDGTTAQPTAQPRAISSK